jgi:carbonic anhydrase/acetyltransferase-like protein (isoleucine patch superfamily)
LVRSGAGAAAVALAGPALLQAASAQDATPRPSPGPSAGDGVANGPRAIVFNGSSFINPLVELYGDISVGERCYVAGNTILLADEGLRIALGDENNCQDNAYLLARENNLMFGNMVSIAHHAVIENSTIGDFTFFGFRSRVRNATVEEGAMILHQAIVEEVTIPANRIVPVGAQVLNQADVDALPELEEENVAFKEEVQGVNVEFVEGYIKLFEEFGRSALTGVGPNPLTSWSPEWIEPTLGEGVELAELVRVVGDVRLGDQSTVGQRTAIRADEGTPITIGHRARIQSRVTFHALKGTSIEVGDDAQIGDGNVIHGPVVIGDNFVSEDDCVVFQATVEDNVIVRAGATIAGELTLREGTIVPEQTVVLTQEEADALPVS